jgi:LytTr DNA-binding domain
LAEKNQAGTGQTLPKGRLIFTVARAFLTKTGHQQSIGAIHCCKSAVHVRPYFFLGFLLFSLQSKSLTPISMDSVESLINRKMFNTYTNKTDPQYSQATGKENILLLGTSNGLEIIDTNSILRVEAISNYSKLFFTDGRSLVVAKLLSWFEEKLGGVHFTRLHRGHLVNIRYIRSYNKFNGAEVVLVNNEKLAVSRRKRIEFKKAIYHYYRQSH